ncbi:4629_t:CDS:2, partial [Entrophospora sp. SA101]
SKSPDNQLIEPKFKKGDAVELSGHYSNSPHSIRKSFTAILEQAKSQLPLLEKEAEKIIQIRQKLT